MASTDSRLLHRNVLASMICFQSLFSVVYLCCDLLLGNLTHHWGIVNQTNGDKHSCKEHAPSTSGNQIYANKFNPLNIRANFQ